MYQFFLDFGVCLVRISTKNWRRCINSQKFKDFVKKNWRDAVRLKAINFCKPKILEVVAVSNVKLLNSRVK